jgi:hypothetical protein
MMFYFQSGQLGHSTNTIILKSNNHKLHAWVFNVIFTFQSSQFFERVSMHFGVVYNFWASALTTADRRPSSWNRKTDRTISRFKSSLELMLCVIDISTLNKTYLIFEHMHHLSGKGAGKSYLTIGDWNYYEYWV